MAHPLPSPSTYHPMSRLLHWFMGCLFLAMLALGWGRHYAPPSAKDVIFSLHETLGFMLLLLLALRVLLRLCFAAPMLVAPSRQKIAALLVHSALYLMMLAMPLTGWLCLSARGQGLPLAGLATIPALMEKNRALGALLKDAHGWLAYGFLGLIALHAAAALYHHFIRRDDTLARMTGKKKGG